MFKVLVEGCTPTRGTRYSACVDLYASEDVIINKGGTGIVGLGICISTELDDTELTDSWDTFKLEHFLQLEPRSSLRAKGIIACTGIIDMDYRDEIKIILHNTKDSSFTVSKGDRIAQITMIEHKSSLFGIVCDVERNGGFGSTNEKS